MNEHKDELIELFLYFYSLTISAGTNKYYLTILQFSAIIVIRISPMLLIQGSGEYLLKYRPWSRIITQNTIAHGNGVMLSLIIGTTEVYLPLFIILYHVKGLHEMLRQHKALDMT